MGGRPYPEDLATEVECLRGRWSWWFDYAGFVALLILMWSIAR